MVWVSMLAPLFSYVGTIPGGIWRDQSWGAISWGWDPKGDGALIIVWERNHSSCTHGGLHIDERGIAVD